MNNPNIIYNIKICQQMLKTRGSRSLRSAEKGVLEVPFARTAAMQNCTFSEVVPRI